MRAPFVYLFFNGKCEAAFNFYKAVFGGEFSDFRRFADMPGATDGGCTELSDVDRNRVMHVCMPLGGGMLMGSDALSDMPTVVGDNFGVSIGPESRAEADRLFNALGEGGEARMPMEEAFWGDYFGMTVDKFGVRWMINCEAKK